MGRSRILHGHDHSVGHLLHGVDDAIEHRAPVEGKAQLVGAEPLRVAPGEYDPRQTQSGTSGRPQRRGLGSDVDGLARAGEAVAATGYDETGASRTRVSLYAGVLVIGSRAGVVSSFTRNSE